MSHGGMSKKWILPTRNLHMGSAVAWVCFYVLTCMSMCVFLLCVPPSMVLVNGQGNPQKQSPQGQAWASCMLRQRVINKNKHVFFHFFLFGAFLLFFFGVFFLVFSFWCFLFGVFAWC